MINKLQLRILADLPAWEAQQRMAPPLRKPLPDVPSSVRQSAVCILLYYKKEELHTILIKRTEDGKTHGGQISFPGGSLDDNDYSHVYCAIRECEEEIGLPKNNLIVLGTISNLYIPPSNFMVTPIVCYCNDVKNLVPSENEVAEIIEVPLSQLFDDSIKQRREVWRSSDKSKSIEAPIYEYQGYVVWGATAMILAEFEDIYKSCL